MLTRRKDAIHLRGLEFYAYHGVLPEENLLGQRFIVDVDLFLDLAGPGHSDKVEETVSYAEVYEVVRDCVSGERHHLLESLAESVAAKILAQFPCEEVRVEVHKPQAPVPGIFSDLAVEIWRRRDINTEHKKTEKIMTGMDGS